MNSNLHSERLSLTLHDILMPSGKPTYEPDFCWNDFPQAVPTNFVCAFRNIPPFLLLLGAGLKTSLYD